MITTTESVANTLERELMLTLERWMVRVEEVPALMSVTLSYESRIGHLPSLLQDLVIRLRLDDDAARSPASAAREQGVLRLHQGYSVPMLVEDWRLLQVSLFDTLRRNQDQLDPDLVMQGVVIIADECDAQLREIVEAFIEAEQEIDQKVKKVVSIN
ncbi:MAG TPA: hypothetical protein VM056_04250 [Terriglobales bacterium]|nr:hypothetical protein [Terriglobales bacterium]